MLTLPITLTAAGAATLINLWLAVGTSRRRGAAKIMLGDGGDAELIARMRAQANFIEYTPLVLILIGLIELSLGTSGWLWATAAVYLVGRLFHGIGLVRWLPGRYVGTILTLVISLGLAITAIAVPYWTAANTVTSTIPTAP